MKTLPDGKVVIAVFELLDYRIASRATRPDALSRPGSYGWRVVSWLLIPVIVGICPQISSLGAVNLVPPSLISREITGSGDGYFDSAAREAIEPGVLVADRFSATSIGDVLTLLFDSAKVDLQTQNDALIGTWLGTVRVPTRPGAKPKSSYLQHLRGSVDKTEGTRVSVVVDVGGKTFTTEFPYGTTRHGDFLREFVSPILKQTNSYTATILIIAERRDPKSAVLVTVDGLDVDAKSGGKRKKK